MILRKPYAFFIKHFRLIHAVLAILVFYSIYKTNALLSFFNEYTGKVVNVIGQDLTGTFFTTFMTLAPILIIIFTSMIMAVMIVKKKPIIFYVINIAIFAYLLIVLQIANSTLYNMERQLLDLRSVLLVRDLLMGGFIGQIFSSLIVSIRATGFNIKKFDFSHDLKELEIEEADREEFEVELNVDANKTRRFIRKMIRYTKYKFKENRLIVIGTSVGVLIVSIIGVVVYFKSRPIILNQKQVFSQSGFNMSVVDSYLTTKDYLGNVIEKDSSFLIVKLKVKNNSQKGAPLDEATTKIVIGNYVYVPTITYRENLFDFGNLYEGEVISNDYVYKNLVYKIPTLLTDEKIVFSFVDKVASKDKFKKINVNINYTNLDTNNDQKTYNIGENVSLENTPLSNYQFNINSYEISPSFRINYNSCYSKICYPSYEYLKPSIMSNYNKVLLKIQGNLISDPELQLMNIYNLYDFIYYFGKLQYQINGEIKTQNIKFKQVKSNYINQKDTYYLEVLDEVVNADKISLVLTIRGQIYEYVLK